jgi:hypothetical protein
MGALRSFKRRIADVRPKLSVKRKRKRTLAAEALKLDRMLAAVAGAVGKAEEAPK